TVETGAHGLVVQTGDFLTAHGFRAAADGAQGSNACNREDEGSTKPSHLEKPFYTRRGRLSRPTLDPERVCNPRLTRCKRASRAGRALHAFLLSSARQRRLRRPLYDARG